MRASGVDHDSTKLEDHSFLGRVQSMHSGKPAAETAMHMRVVKLFTSLLVSMFVAGGIAHARTQKFTGSLSGTAANVPTDLVNDSCFTASNGATFCTDTSGYNNFAGKRSPADSSPRGSSEEDSANGGFTGQTLTEFDAVPGTRDRKSVV